MKFVHKDSTHMTKKNKMKHTMTVHLYFYLACMCVKIWGFESWCHMHVTVFAFRIWKYVYMLQKSQPELPSDVDLDIFLANGHKVTVNIKSTDKTDDILSVIV